MQYVHNLFNAIDRIPGANTLPDFVDRDVRQGEDYSRLNKMDLRKSIKSELTEMMEPYAERRRAEQELAGYIENIANGLDDLELKEHLLNVSLQMFNCRQSGRTFKEGDELYTAWDYKCSQTKLCPDESREESQRLAEFYLPELIKYKKDNGLNRIFYSVFTDANYPLGELKNGKKEIIEKFRAFRESLKYFAQDAERKHATDKNNKTEFAGAFCPVTFFDVYGEAKRIRSFIKDIVFPPDAVDLNGSLIIQEDPLSARGDWNIHINVFLLVKGRFDWKLARSLWGKDCFFNEIKHTKENPNSIRKSLLEAIKYSAQILPVKSQSKANNKQTLAPWMCEWEPEIFLEWFKANKLFRRTRAYGCLYKVHERRWNESDTAKRVEVSGWAEVALELGFKAGTNRFGTKYNEWLEYDWKELLNAPSCSIDPEHEHDYQQGLKRSREKLKVNLRNAMVKGEPDRDGLNAELIGKVIFTECGSYSVDSIRGNNFFEDSRNSLAHNYYNDPGGGLDEQSYQEYRTFKAD